MNRPLNRWKIGAYKAGENVVCKVVAAEPGGYAVNIPKDNLSGFLPTEQKLKIGEEVLAQFVCVHNNRVLLSSRLSGTQLAQHHYNKVPATQWDVNGQKSSESDVAFQVWAETHNPKLRRAIDLILPPFEGHEPTKFKMGDHNMMWLITDLEGGMRTGCLKAFSEERLSRSAMLLYRGRVVGCLYGNKTMTEPEPSEASLHYMLADLALPETDILLYDLPEDITLCMSALFLGYPVEVTEMDAKSYLDYILSWLQQREQTACLAFSLPSTAGNCLAFVHQGQYAGCFDVEEQKFSKDIQFLHQILDKDPQARAETSILPPEMTSNSVRFGYSLSMSLPRTQ